MSWLKEILLTLAKKVTAKYAFILLLVGALGVTGYKIFDRYFDYREAVDLNKPKRVIEKDTTYKELGLSYADYVELYKDSRNSSEAAK